jgi:hypothetical protein
MVAMVTLARSPGGGWRARKAIPVDVREAYREADGLSAEERFSQPASMPLGQVKAEFRDWDATISTRIENLRAAATGAAVDLTKRQRIELIGRWYEWFIAQHEDEPGTIEGWSIAAERLSDAYDQFARTDEDETDEEFAQHPTVRRHVRARVRELGWVESFLTEQSFRLTTDTLDAFTDELEPELQVAFGVLARRAVGDYSPDLNREKFPKGSIAPHATATKSAGMNCWQAFEAWVRERKPAASTVDRWRAVFLAMNDAFEGRDIATITAEDAMAWKGGLVTKDRSPQVANGVWLRAASRVFTWAAGNRLLTSNPFDGVSIAVPRKIAEKREREFTEPEWTTILRATTAEPHPNLAAHTAAARRWVPWLCAYTGSRPGEMTQLRGCDVMLRGGVWSIHITPRPAR